MKSYSFIFLLFFFSLSFCTEWKKHYSRNCSNFRRPVECRQRFERWCPWFGQHGKHLGLPLQCSLGFSFLPDFLQVPKRMVNSFGLLWQESRFFYCLSQLLDLGKQRRRIIWIPPCEWKIWTGEFSAFWNQFWFGNGNAFKQWLWSFSCRPLWKMERRRKPEYKNFQA